MTKRIKISGFLISAALGFAGAYLLIGLQSVGPQTIAQQQDDESAKFVVTQNPVAANANTIATIDLAKMDSATVGLKNVNVEKTVAQILAQKGRFNRLAMAYPVVLKASGEQLAAFINALEDQSGNPDSHVVSRLFYLRYLNLDTKKAMETYWANNSFEGQYMRMGLFNMLMKTLCALYNEWALHDMQAVLYNIEQAFPQKRNDRDMILYRLVMDPHFSQDITLLAYVETNPDLKRMLAYSSPKTKDESFDQA
ncbi:MAG: hypothetical protein HRT35_03420, partial [Algicola sp.]|nr:hypothetical protein [Algicola sp.]